MPSSHYKCISLKDESPVQSKATSGSVFDNLFLGRGFLRGLFGRGLLLSGSLLLRSCLLLGAGLLGGSLLLARSRSLLLGCLIS